MSLGGDQPKKVAFSPHLPMTILPGRVPYPIHVGKNTNTSPKNDLNVAKYHMQFVEICTSSPSKNPWDWGPIRIVGATPTILAPEWFPASINPIRENKKNA